MTDLTRSQVHPNPVTDAVRSVVFLGAGSLQRLMRSYLSEKKIEDR